MTTEIPAVLGCRSNPAAGEMRRWPSLAAWTLLFLAQSSGVGAQPLGGVTLALHDEGYFMLGGMLALPIGGDTSSIMLAASFGFDSQGTPQRFEDWEYWEANVDVVLRTRAEGRLQGFVLGGLNMARAEFVCRRAPCPDPAPRWTTSAGVNACAGFALVWRAFAALIGAKVELKGGAPFVAFLGGAVPFYGP